MNRTQRLSGLRRRRTRAVALAVAATSFAAACGGDDSDSAGTSGDTTAAGASVAADTSVAGSTAYKLAGTAGLASDAFWISVMCGGTAAAKAAGSTIEWKASTTTGDSAADQANIDAVTLAKPDGIVFTPYQTPFQPGFIAGLMAGGTPVTIVNSVSDSTSDYYSSYTSAPADDNVKELGDLIIANSGGSGKVLVLGGLPDVPVLDARWQPARDVVTAANPNIEFLDPQYEKFDVNTATQIVSAAIVANPDLKAVYTTSGPSGEGAVTAIEQAGKQGEILVYSFDATPPIVQALRDGTIAALLAQPARLMGQKAVEGLIDYLEAHPDGGSVTPADPVDQQIPTMVLTKDNIDSPEAEGYIYKQTCEV